MANHGESSHRPQQRWRRVVAALTAVGLVALGLTGGPAGTVAAEAVGTAPANARLAEALLAAVNQQAFDEVLDTAPPASAAARKLYAAGAEKYELTPDQVARTASSRSAAAAPIHQTPNVDATVIALSRLGTPIAAANVLLSPQHPHGKIIPLDANLSTDQVRWRAWSDSTWDTNGGQGTVDALPGRENAPIDFMAPYPASVLKLMVGYGVLRLVDRGVISLDDEYAFDRTGAPNNACGPNVTKKISTFFDEMQTISKNESTCAMIKLLHDHDAVAPLNQHFADLGLPMLQLNGTRTVDGGGWGNVRMNALDTAKLLMIINGGAGRLWTAPDGTPVRPSLLSPASRRYYLKVLGEQGLNQVLSTTNWCGRGYPAAGLPQKISDRWIDPATGKVSVAGREYGQDVRPCQEAAEVTFVHKTGYIDTSGQDAGIVRNLPGAEDRHYIVAIHSNLGSRYIDAHRPADPPGIYPVQYTEKYALFGKAVDDIFTR